MGTQAATFRDRIASRLDGEARDTLRWWLVVAGLILIGLGAPPVLSPAILSFASGGVDVGVDPIALEGQRALGGAILTLGLLMLSGAVLRSLSLTAAIAGSAMYLAYGVSRYLDAPASATPVPVLTAVTALELTIGAMIAAAFLLRRR